MTVSLEPEYKSEFEARLDHALRKALKGCLVLFGVCSVLLLVAYLLIVKPWLPYTEPEIQQILRQEFDATLRGIHQKTEDCAIVYFEDDSVGNHYVKLERQNGQWKYVDNGFWAGGIPLRLECPP